MWLWCYRFQNKICRCSQSRPCKYVGSRYLNKQNRLNSSKRVICGKKLSYQSKLVVSLCCHRYSCSDPSIRSGVDLKRILGRGGLIRIVSHLSVQVIAAYWAWSVTVHEEIKCHSESSPVVGVKQVSEGYSDIIWWERVLFKKWKLTIPEHQKNTYLASFSRCLVESGLIFKIPGLE